MAAYVASTLAAAAPNADAQAISKCKDLGIMKLSADQRKQRDKFRTCKAHPYGRNRFLDDADTSLAPLNEERDATALEDASVVDSANVFGERACYFASPYGCSKGYCWKVCDRKVGKWCWTAEGDGSGPWITCDSWMECNMEQSCGVGENCESCGCGC